MKIISSKTDIAGTGIMNGIKEIINSGKSEIKEHDLMEIEESLLYSDKVIENISDEFILFASRHKSESGKPSFTTHVPGNWGKAEMGGRDGEISYSDPIRMKAIAVGLNRKKKKKDYPVDVTLEVDHHGPLCLKPCAFIEVGSSEAEWKNKKYTDSVAEVINEFEDIMEEIEVKEIAVGVGGGHYCPAFNKHEIDGKIAFAHVIPNYAVNDLKYETFLQAFERSSEEVESIYIDWKGLKQEQRRKIISFCDEYGIEYKRL